MSFSWKSDFLRVQQLKVRRAKTQAKQQHPDYKRKHPDEARDASQGKYTLLEGRVLKEIKLKQARAIERRLQHAGK